MTRPKWHEAWQDAFDEGRRMGNEIETQAKQQSKDILEKARKNIDFEIEKARLSLKNEVAGTLERMKK